MYVETCHIATVQPVAMNPAYIRIGDVSLGLRADSADDLELTREMKRFQTTAPTHCDIDLTVQWTDRLPELVGRKIFCSGSVWALHEDRDGFIFDFATPVLGDQPYKRLAVNRKFSAARLWLNRECLPAGRQVYPLEYPLDELLITNWLGGGRGVEVHGCGLVDHGTGSYLFLGHSGAGKSTTARLWSSLREAKVLSDDRIILRREANEIWMHGTPWHGEAGFASPEKTKVEQIFVLEHGDRNEVLPLAQGRAVAELFARCFPPFYDRDPLAFTLSFLHEITNRVPCYQFRFVPDESAVSEILDFHG